LDGNPVRAAVHEGDLEDVRLALVMNGGVSLAVWIGGVAREIHALAEARPSRGGAGYAGLLDITRSSVKVDVIAGSSAGGLNGAFLALAGAHGTSMEDLADLWIDKGALGRLLRQPSESDPVSLLRGDDYFLPELRDAFAKLWPATSGTLRDASTHPVHLTMTTTLMAGDVRVFTDDYGTDIQEVVHRGAFTFRRGRRTDPAAVAGPRADPFRTRGVIEQLALAARSTASFPFAFEPSWVPIGSARDGLHPDMAEVANFSVSGWVLDGGVLVNRPVERALRVVFDQPAERQVRRALLYVDPHPDPVTPTIEADPSAGPDGRTPPSLRQVVLDSLVNLPRVQSLAETFEDLRRHNELVRAQRAFRLDLADLVTGPTADLDRLADELWPSYRRARARRAARHVVELGRTAGALRTSSTTEPWWSADELAAAFERAHAADLLPFVPQPTALAEDTSEGWGIAYLERLAFLCLDLTRRAMWLAPIERYGPARRDQIRILRTRLHETLFSLPSLRAEDHRFWEDALDALPALPGSSDQRQERLDGWLATALTGWPLPTGAPDPAGVSQARRGLDELAGMLAGILLDAEPQLRAVTTAATSAAPASATAPATAPTAGLPAEAFPGAATEAAELDRLIRLVYDARTGSMSDRLHRLEVVHVMLASDAVLEQPVELMQLDGNTPNSFGGPEVIDRKLTGTRTGHFAAFYKASWRANDWLWGRLDGATRLTQLTLDPGRLRQLADTPESALAAVREAAVGPPPPGDAPPTVVGDHAELAARFDTNGCAEELRYLDDLDLPVPPSLPTCAMQIARRRHLAILREDLGRLAAAVDDDEVEGARRSGAGPRFRTAYRQAVETSGSAADIPAATLFRLMASCELGAEAIADDAGSDLYAGTVSQSAAVSMATLDSKHAGLGPARVLTRPLRGLLLILYALIAGSTRFGRAAQAAVALALAAGGALLAIALLQEEIPPFVATLGAALVVGGVAMSALRSRAWQFGVVLGLPVLAVLGFLLFTTAREQVALHAPTLWTVGGLTLAAFLLGSVRQPDAPPRPFHQLTVRQARDVAALGFAVAAMVYLWVAWEGAGWWPVLSLTFAGTVPDAAATLGDVASLADLRAAVLTDFLLIAAYAVTLVAWAVLALRHVAGLPLTRWRWGGERLGRALPRPAPVGASQLLTIAAWAGLSAALLDVVENLALLRMIAAYEEHGAALEGALSAVVPALAWIAAVLKFTLILAVILGGAAGLLLRADPPVDGP
jgi:patatin-related protein